MCLRTPHGAALVLLLWSIDDCIRYCANAIEKETTCKEDQLQATRQGMPQVLLQSSSRKLRDWGKTLVESSHLVSSNTNTTQPTSQGAENISFVSRRVNFVASPQGEPLDEIDKVKKSMHTAVAIMLLGFVAFVMALFYLVNFPDEDIKAATWKLLSTTMSIFIALLMFSGTQHFLTFVTGTGTSESKGDGDGDLRVAIGHEEVTHDIILFAFARFIIFWLLLQLHLYFVHGRHIAHKPQADSEKSYTLKGVAAIGSHIVAFSGMDAFGTVQEQGFFAGNLFHCIAGVILVGGALFVLFDVADIVRRHIVQKRNSNLEARQEWKEWVSECNSAQYESASLILGLLLSQCIRFGITGNLPPLEGGSPMGKSRTQVHMLFAVAICLGTLVVALQITLRKTLGEQSWSKGWTKRFLRAIREILATTMAWCLTYWGRWAFWMSTEDSGLGYGDKMTALLATSLFMSIFCFAGVLGIDFIADNLVGESGEAGCVALIRSLGLVLGLAWESTFHEALGAIGSVHLFPVNYELNVLILICILVITTLPAWMIYILPEANKDRGPLCHIRSDDEDDD